MLWLKMLGVVFVAIIACDWCIDKAKNTNNIIWMWLLFLIEIFSLFLISLILIDSYGK